MTPADLMALIDAMPGWLVLLIGASLWAAVWCFVAHGLRETVYEREFLRRTRFTKRAQR